MKYIMAGVSFFIGLQALAAPGGRPDFYTTRIVHIKSVVTFEQAKQNFDALNSVLSKLKGFEKRNLYYDKEQKVWIDQIKWKHAEAAKSGENTLSNDPAFANLTKITETGPTTIYQSERVTEFDAPK